MNLSYHEKARAAVRVGEELQRRGWTILGYTEDRSDSRSDYFCPASWSGIAIWPDRFPNVVAAVYVTGSSRSGKEQISTRYVPGEACAACGGTGVEPDARTDDGRPRCLACHGRGHDMREESRVECTWPTFEITPRGKFWAVQLHGRTIGSGTGFERCASFNGWERNVASICDEIEGIARRTIGRATSTDATADAAAEGQPDLSPTHASRRGFAVSCTYTSKEGYDIWTWPAITPRVSRDVYERARSTFSIETYRFGKKMHIRRYVSAQEILDVLVPPAVEAPQQATPPEPTPPTRHERILGDIAGLSSGTLATLTGLECYQALDEAQQRFAAWFSEARPDVVTWQQAWDAFLDAHPDTFRAWLVALADTDESVLGFGATWDGGAQGRYRLVRTRVEHARWQAQRLGSGRKLVSGPHSDRQTAQAEIDARSALDTPPPTPAPEPGAEATIPADLAEAGWSLRTNSAGSIYRGENGRHTTGWYDDPAQAIELMRDIQRSLDTPPLTTPLEHSATITVVASADELPATEPPDPLGASPAEAPRSRKRPGASASAGSPQQLSMF